MIAASNLPEATDRSPRSANARARAALPAHASVKAETMTIGSIRSDMVSTPELRELGKQIAGEREATPLSGVHRSSDRHDDADERGVAASESNAVVQEPELAHRFGRDRAAVDRIPVENERAIAVLSDYQSSYLSACGHTGAPSAAAALGWRAEPRPSEAEAKCQRKLASGVGPRRRCGKGRDVDRPDIKRFPARTGQTVQCECTLTPGRCA